MNDEPEQAENGTYSKNQLKAAGYGIWKWDASRSSWQLIEDRTQAGARPGPGPSGPGRFDGQVVRWAAVTGPEGE